MTVRLFLTSGRFLQGNRAQGCIHYSVESTSCPSNITTVVTKVDSRQFENAIAENMVQLEHSDQSEKKKREFTDDDARSLTDAKQWHFVECSHDSKGVNAKVPDRKDSKNNQVRV